MKLFIALLLMIILSCSNNDNVTITKKEYNQLKGISTEYPKHITIDDFTWEITKGSDGHEYCDNNQGNGYICFHYPGCIKCKKDTIK